MTRDESARWAWNECLRQVEARIWNQAELRVMGQLHNGILVAQASTPTRNRIFEQVEQQVREGRR